jgi:uncharacterized protein YndB with AHSA1/START domain
MSNEIVSESRVIAAPAAAIFALLADPAQHARFDGSGTVQKSRPEAPNRLTLGSRFGMDMRIGVPYRMTNTVVEFEDDRCIGWRHFGGHVWRYLLDPTTTADGSPATNVTEQFDWSTARSKLYIRLSGFPARNRKSIVATLERLDALVTSTVA